MHEGSAAPDCFQVTLITLDGTRTIAVGRDERIWDAAQQAGILLPAICHQGRCLTCAGKLLQPGDFDQDDADVYFPEDRESGFILLCTARPRSDLLVQTHTADQMREHRLEQGLPTPYA